MLNCSKLITWKHELIKVAQFLVIVGLVLACAEAMAVGEMKNEHGSKAFSLERLESTPDLMQSLPEAALPDDGQTYCGPVAVANSMVWLSYHGYPRLSMLGGADTPSTQGRLARKLGDYMGSGNGTNPTGFLKGLERYVKEHGYAIASLQYEGWEEHPTEYSRSVIKPDPDWIRTGLNDNSCAWLMIGWYQYRCKLDLYSPYDQHWVTLVGFGKNKYGKEDPNILVIHDPAPRSGRATSHDYVHLERINHGRFSINSGRKNLTANGWYKLTGDLKIKKGADCGIIDGAVIMRMEVPCAK